MSQEILILKRDRLEAQPGVQSSTQKELDLLLFNGATLRHGESFVALPREVIQFEGSSESVVFELVRSEEIQKPSLIRVLLRAIRPETWVMAWTPCLAVFLYGLGQSWNFNPFVALLASLGAVFLYMSVKVLNDVEDHLRLIDIPGTLGGAGVIQKGWMSAKTLQQIGYLALALGVLCGVSAIFSPSPQQLLLKEKLLIGVIGALGVLAYSSQPLGIKYRPWGDFSVFILLGPLLCIGYALAVMGQVDLGVILLGCFFGFISLAVVHANNLQDIEFDRTKGLVTLASYLGFRKSRYLFLGAYGLAYLVAIAGVLSGSFSPVAGIAVLFALPFFYPVARRLFKASGPASALLGQIRFDASRMYWVLSLLMCLGLLIQFVQLK